MQKKTKSHTHAAVPRPVTHSTATVATVPPAMLWQRFQSLKDRQERLNALKIRHSAMIRRNETLVRTVEGLGNDIREVQADLNREAEALDRDLMTGRKAN